MTILSRPNQPGLFLYADPILIVCAPRPPHRRRARPPAAAQIAPSQSELRIYAGLHAAAAKGDGAEIERLIAAGQSPNTQDAHSRTALHVAAHFGHQAAAAALLKGGANPNALDAQRYDIVTIAAVNNDMPMLKLALAGGCDAKAITSPYQGTALVAAAHLGHAEVVGVLIAPAPARSCQQSRLDRVDGVDRARQWRQGAYRHASRRW